MKRIRILAPFILFVSAVACDGAEPEPEVSAASVPEEAEASAEEAAEEPTPECTERARGAVMSLKQGLMQRLTAALAESPEAAVDVCSREAEEIRARVQRESGVQGGRASTRLRNHAANGSPPAWVRTYLDEHSQGEEASEWSERTDGEARVVSPLMTGGLCLTCHGEDLAPPVVALLDERYPDDEARGYHAGELRGVVWANAICD